MSETERIDCEEVLSRLFEYLDGEMEGRQSERVQAHLKQCRSCMSRIEFETRLKARLAELGRADVSPGLAQRVRWLMNELTAPERSR